jgi:hypothetical protein
MLSSVTSLMLANSATVNSTVIILIPVWAIAPMIDNDDSPEFDESLQFCLPI